MDRLLTTLVVVLLALAPAGVGFGLGWWVHPGLGVAAGALLYGLLGVSLLFVNLPDHPREVSR